MVAELIDVFRAHLTNDQAWLVTLLGFATILLLHKLSFQSNKRTLAFALILGISFLLLFDARLFFVIPYFLVWRFRGWKQYGAAITSLFIGVDGFVLLAYTMWKNRRWEGWALGIFFAVYVLVMQTFLFSTPFFHFVRNVQGQGFESDFPHLTWAQYVVMMYDMFWGWQGVLVGFIGVLSAAWLMAHKDRLTQFYCVAWTAYIIIRPYLLADLWRYFMPHIMIMSGLIWRQKDGTIPYVNGQGKGL